MADPVTTVTTVTALTTAVKNAVDVTNTMISVRKRNQLVTSAQIQYYKNTIRETLNADRMRAVHALTTNQRNYLIDSMKQVSEYVNTPIGPMLLETLRDEFRDLRRCIDDYTRLT